MQEVLHPQLEDLLCETFSGNDWNYIGVGRDDGATKGEYSPIFYSRLAWNCVHFETVWLNEDGAVGQKGWDASSIRILTVGVLESVLPDEKSKTILALNTHLDDQGVVARREAAKVIIGIASDMQARFPAISFTFLSGDLNSTPDGDAYKVLNSPRSGFVDARRLVEDSDVYGDELTFTGFPGDRAAEGRERIDFVHIGVCNTPEQGRKGESGSSTDSVSVKGYGVLPNRFDDGRWLSDHRGVVVDLMI
jgi:endonuclease/exonuclease/phosphatase family metal-dependent hydrolase